MQAKVLCIGQSDPTAVSGVQADLRAVEKVGCQPLTVVTAVSIQNDREVTGLFPLPAEAVHEQIGCVVAEGLPQAVKLGALICTNTINVVGDFLDEFAKSGIPVIVDPVIAFRDSIYPLDKEAIDAFKRRILIRGLVLMPNVWEAEILTGMKIRELEEKEHAAHMMMTLGARTVIITSGAMDRETLDDVLVDDVGHKVYSAKGRPNLCARGAETRLAAGMAACMAQGMPVRKAYEKVRDLM